MLYTLANRCFFENVVNLQHEDTYAQALRPALPHSWQARITGVWLAVASPAHTYPLQGFKIHLSGRVAQAAEIIRAAAPVCFAHDTPFKTARDPPMLSIMASRHYPRAAGKLMTVYPSDLDKFLRLIDDRTAPPAVLKGRIFFLLLAGLAAALAPALRASRVLPMHILRN